MEIDVVLPAHPLAFPHVVPEVLQLILGVHIHPYIAAYINQGVLSLKRKWQMKYGFGIKIIPNQKLAFLEYIFYDPQGEEIDMKEEIEIK